MAKLLASPSSPLLHPLNYRPKLTSRFRVRAEIQETPPSSSSSSSSSTPSISIVSEPSSIVSPPPGFKPPEPKRFLIRPDKFLDILGASLALLFRLATGAFVLGYSLSLVASSKIPSTEYAMGFAGLKLKETGKLGPRPEKLIEIYEFEGCPYCRKVREIISVLDLDVLFYPCPKQGPTFRAKVIQMGGKQQFPYMVDPNTGVSMYESDAMVNYLVNKYGDGTVPLMLSLGQLTTRTARLAMIARKGKGTFYTPSKLPPVPLELWAYEASPFCKIVREVLVELELPHILRSAARGSPKRQILFKKAGRFLVPYLEDPNTGVKLFESAYIIDYLKATYTS